MSNNRGKVLIAAPVHPLLTEGLAKAGFTCLVREKITQDEAHTLIADCTGVITSTRLQLDKQLINAAPLLKWIGRMGSGMEVIDLEYAAGRGVICFGSPEGNCNAVGEHAVGMLLTLIRRIVVSGNELRHGIWQRDENRGMELEGKTIGIIGFGHTGRAFAKKLMGFDMRILAYDKYSSPNVPDYVTGCDNLDEIYQQADIVSFHVPFNAETHHYFDDAFLDAMRKPFILVNTSRGTVVDTHVTYKGILNGKIVGCCLDVYEAEPISKMPPKMGSEINEMMNMTNVVTTPHIAGYTFEALYKMSKALLDKVLVI